MCKQLNNMFTITESERQIIYDNMEVVLDRLNTCFAPNKNGYYDREGQTYFNPFHSAQNCLFLYMLSNNIYRMVGRNGLSDRLYCLNKLLSGCDLYYEIELPKVIKTDHPVGTVLGRATYGNYFCFIQGCTVGNNRGIFPVIGDHVTMLSDSKLIGNCHIGDNVIIAANTYIKDEDVPSNSIVFGSSPNLIIKNNKSIPFSETSQYRRT